MNSTAFEKILRRNIILPLAMTLTLCAVFVVLFYNMLAVNEDLTESSRLIARQNNALRLIVDSETGLRGYLLTGSVEYLGPRERAAREIPERFRELDVLGAEFPAQKAAFDRVRTGYEAWDRAAVEAIAHRKRTGRYTFDAISLRKDLMDQVRGSFEELLTETMRVREERAAAATRNVRLAVGIVLVFSLVLGGILAFLGRSQLLGLSRNYEGALDAQREQNAELTRQGWLREGQAGLARAIRGDRSLEQIADTIVSYVAEYAGAELGALFVAGEQGTLTRSGAFALAPDAPRRFESSEGLVGRAARSGALLVVDDVPESHAKLASALGESKPRHLALMPLAAEGHLQGVLELGFLKEPSERVRELLAAISEIAGGAIRSAVYRARLQDLLAESQQLAEELQAQQEELRVSNEELSERSAALQESTARLESQQSELEQTNEQLEEQAQALESQRNDLDRQNSALLEVRRELEEKAEQLEAASRYKSEFLANMSHELRTPLNSSLILAKLLQDNSTGNLSEEQVHFAQTIYEAGNDLLSLINDILDLSKVEAGKLDLNVEDVPVARIAQSIERVFRPIADQKGLRFEVKTDPGLPKFRTDRQRVEQILRNLLSNAMKFTASGTVALEIASAGNDRVRIAVRDTGIGIDPAQHRKIFEAFHQGDGTISRKYGGTGLGLSISRSLAELLGGTLTVDSRRGEGSTFVLDLPREYAETGLAAPDAVRSVLAPGAAPDPKAPAPRRRAGEREAPAPSVVSIAPAAEFFGFADDRDRIGEKDRRILLVVEDTKDFAKVLLDLGRELDFKVLLAHTTSDGYALALRYLPTAAILDMRLPDALGLTLLDRLKENPKTRHIPVHAMSVADYSREALHLGAIGFLMKPADREALKDTVRKLEQKNAQRVKRVLVVEDDRTQRESIEKLIGDPGVEIDAVETGRDALAALAKATFDCMIIDLRLPDMSGFQLLEEMAADEDRAFPPVIVYTGHDLSRAEEERLRRYSRSIIIKGARSPERLLDEVTLFLHQVESNLSSERQQLIRAARTKEKAFEGRRILLVDDDVRNIFALTSALETKGAKIVVARNGREAVEQVESSRDDGAALDLVLMDIMMPEMDGYEAIRRIRARKEYADLPIIAVTAKAMRDDYEKCLEVGANDYLAKPVDLDRLISLMRVWLPKQIGRA